jgi:CO/xanthine dehydrogenase Mo-binding subunit
MNRETKVVGSAVERLDAADKVTGKAVYTADLKLERMAEGKVLRSCYPHARLRAIHVEEAAKLDGVLAIVTGQDFKDDDPYLGSMYKDQPVIAIDRARFVGEAVAAVAAVNGAVAEEALRLITVDYEEIPSVTSIEHAMSDEASVIHEQIQTGQPIKNLCFHEHLEKGDVQLGFKLADKIFEDTFEYPMVTHYSMEPHAAIGDYKADLITVWSPAQDPFVVRSELASVFRFPLARVRVSVPYIGGSYGSKGGTKIEPLALALSRKIGRPVRIVQTVAESMLTSRRHSAKCWVKTGVSAGGEITAREARVYLDTGAYTESGPNVTSRACVRILGPYRYPHFKVDAYSLFTNSVPASSYRAVAGAQTVWASESQMDMIAAGLKMDRLKFRLGNLLKRGEPLYPGVKALDANLHQGLRRVIRELNTGGKKGRNKNASGIAVGVTNSGGSGASTAVVRLHQDASVSVVAGTTEIGQGAHTILSQIAAEELSVPFTAVSFCSPDTAFTSFDASTHSSRSTTVMGEAVWKAARDAKQQLIRIVSKVAKQKPATIRFDGGVVECAGRQWSLKEIFHAHFGSAGGEIIGRGYTGKKERPLFWEVGLGAAEVEVDAETGKINVKKYVTGADVGKAINPKHCEGQDEGAAIQGLGPAFFENLLYDAGHPRNASLVNYRVPKFGDVPGEFATLLFENGDGPGPFGAKGMGEGGILCIAPAIGNALEAACGARIKVLPLTPERVWRAMAGK